jgi:hypothetical protein
MLDHVNYVSALETKQAGSHRQEDAGDETLVEAGQCVMLWLGDRIICALRRLDGEDGAALGHALIDMVMSGEVPPCCWPLREAIESLSRCGESDRRTKVVHRALIWLAGAVERASGRG